MSFPEVPVTKLDDSGAIIIDVGTLSSLSALHRALAPALKNYNALFRKGERPSVVFDLTNVQPGRISMAALTALLSTADRLRPFSGTSAQVRLNWNPNVFGFFHDIGFFRLATERDLFDLPDELMGGYAVGKTNPNTQLLFFENRINSDITARYDLPELKDAVRQEVKEALLMMCGALFRSSRHSATLPVELRDQIAVTSAELVVNAQLWGNSNAYAGLQRSPRGITVCVCDSGVGFYSSLYRNTPKKPPNTQLNGHLDSLLLGCVLNNEDFGLRRAIDMVTRFNGWVSTSSYSAEILWQSTLWKEWLAVYGACCYTDQGIEQASRDFLNRYRIRRGEYDSASHGYCKQWDTPLRGSRISFEIPLNSGN